MADDSDSKTEEPTEKRIHDAIESGNVPVSREVTLLMSLCAYLVIETLILPANTAQLAATLMHFVDDPAGWRLSQAHDVVQLIQILAFSGARLAMPAMLLMMAFGVGASVFQNMPRIVPGRIMPDLSRISPGRGLSRMFGPAGWTQLAKSAAKLAAIGGTIALLLAGQRNSLLSAMYADAADLPQRMLAICAKATAAVTLVMLVIAGADITWSRIHWRRDQRMSKQEIKDEVKQAEGDRVMKARFRSLRLARMRKRMLGAVPKATMVVVNPTHYAVALRYVRSEGGAPVVLAKGVDLIALKICEIATEHAIPIIEDKPLARSLYDAVPVDSVIPPEFYRAVAEVVHMIQDKRSSWHSTRRRIN